jgi:hypothetical protein
MPVRLFSLPVLLLGLSLSPAAADPGKSGKPLKPASALPLLPDGSPSALAGTLRAFLIDVVPSPLYQAQPGWGHRAEVPSGLKWKGRGLRGRPSVQKSFRNHGTWRKIEVQAPNLRDSLVVDVRDVHKHEAGHMTFTVFLSFDARVNVVQEKWEWGVRVYAGSARARLRVRLALNCDCVTRLERKGWLLPDAVFRLRVLRSDLRYDNLVFEHFAGFGGTAAKVLGDTVMGRLKKWRPSLERKLLDRANAAIVKAGDTREVRISLGKLLKMKE